ncbi:hypothetical protein AVEN_68609-1 [Araneus ventricosus]|uniref:Reverse transcriptase domain-containing protein n=1 Tax=Araneus ventricosus TaxID=182803 RepID=A0A4Y2M5J8_ARAVE|nr:hypothetical protein AVEN_68609-1 [Araneus ventricosus]
MEINLEICISIQLIYNYYKTRHFGLNCRKNIFGPIQNTKNLQVLSDWSDENNMAVNLEKSASQAFSLTHETFRPELQYQNTSTANTDSFTYLGVTFDNKLSWRLHVERLSERVKNRLSILKRLAG